MDKKLPVRKANRLKDFDYSSNGIYFVTVCVKDMKCILSAIVGGDDPGAPQLILKEYGEIVRHNLAVMEEIYNDLHIEKYVIMPNHIHLLIDIYDENRTDGAPRSSPPTNKLSNFISAFKKFTEKETGKSIWQRGFHDHIIRDDADYQSRWQYIDENPRKWAIGKDKYYT